MKYPKAYCNKICNFLSLRNKSEKSITHSFSQIIYSKFPQSCSIHFSNIPDPAFMAMTSLRWDYHSPSGTIAVRNYKTAGFWTP